MSDLRGKVVLIDFWTYTCINCIRTLPYLEAWQQRYGQRRLHGRRRPLARVPVREGRRQRPGRDPAERPHLPGRPGQRPGDLERLGQPVLAGRLPDRRPGQRPLRPLRRGRLRRDRAGDPHAARRRPGHSNLGSGARAAAQAPSAGATTPETYLGAARAQGWVNGADPARRPGLRRRARRAARQPFAYAGDWGITDEDATSATGAGIDLEFNARRVFLVLGSPDQARHVQVLLDGKPIPAKLAGADVRHGEATIQAQRLYRLVDLPAVAQHRLSLRFDPGITGYAFTFG